MRMTEINGIFRRPGVLAVCFLAALSLSRLILTGMHWERVAPTNGLGITLLQGFRFDLVLLASLLGPVFFFKPWFHTAGFLTRIGNWLIPV